MIHHAHFLRPPSQTARLLAVVVILLASAVQAAEPGPSPKDGGRTFRAGAATSNITPMLGGEIVGNFVTPPAQRIHDELHARCLVLDDGQTRLAFVVCDNVGIAREVFDEAKRLVHESTGLAAENMLMSSTHTHSATSARPGNVLKPDAALTEYQSFVSRRIADGVRRAINHLEPARIAWGSADEPRPLFNRRYTMKPGTELLKPLGGVDQVKTNPGAGNPDVLGPAGPTDPQVSFISVKAADGRPIALLANYSLHYVGGMRPDEISGDYFAVFADRIQQRLGADRLDPPFVGILSNGTSGDVNNINVMAGRLKQKLGPYEQIGRVADMVADAVSKADASVVFHDWVPLRAATRELKLKVRKPTPEAADRARRLVAGDAKPNSSLELIYAGRALQLLDSPDEIAVPLQVFKIGALGVAAVPFEVFTQSGLDLKARSPLQPSFTISQANGAYGYLPTPEQHELGGYETWLGTNRVEVEASTKIVDTLLAMFGQLERGQ